MDNVPVQLLIASDAELPPSDLPLAPARAKHENLPCDCRALTPSREEAGHAFRGKYLDRCALVEQWATDILFRVARAPGRKLKVPPTFGLKIEALRKLAEEEFATSSEKAVFEKPGRVLHLLEQFSPYLNMRSQIGHAKLEIVRGDDGSDLLLFRSICYSENNPGWTHVLISEEEQVQALRRVKQLAKEFRDQSIR